MLLSNLLLELSNGQLNTVTNYKDQSYKMVNETKDGKETGFKTVKAVGGNVNFNIAENALLRTVQGYLVAKRFVTFGDQSLHKFADVFSIENGALIQDDFKASALMSELENKGVKVSALTSKVEKYLDGRNIPLAVSHLDAVLILSAMANFCSVGAKANIKQATEDDRLFQIERAKVANKPLLDALAALKAEAEAEKAEAESAKAVAATV